jgi:hypothetical protein
MAFGDNPALDKAMAISMNEYNIARKIEENPALYAYKSPDFIKRAARWSYKEFGWGIAALDEYIDFCKTAKTSPVRLYYTNIKLWHRIRSDIFLRDNHTCTYCGVRGGTLEVDHIKPVSKGGTNDYENLTTACMPCNRSKRDKTVGEFNAWKAKR